MAVFIVLLLVVGGVVAAAVILLKKKVRILIIFCPYIVLPKYYILYILLTFTQDQETRRYVDSVVSSYLPMADENDEEQEQDKSDTTL